MRLQIVSALSLAAFATSIGQGACANTGGNESTLADDAGTQILTDASADGPVLGSDATADADANIDPCVSGALCPVARFGTPDTGAEFDSVTRINVIRGRSPSDVWAAGSAGAMAHFDGTAWKRSQTPTQESVRALWLRQSGEMAWMSMHPASTFVRGVDLEAADGAQMSADGWLSAKDVPVPGTLNTTLTAAWSTAEAEWLWGTTAGLSVEANGSQNNGLWRARIDNEARSLEIEDALPAGACNKLGCWWMEAVHGSSANDLWAVGRHGTTLHVTDAQSGTPTITSLDSQTWAALNGVWAFGSEMFAVGGVGTIRHYPGTGDSLDVVNETQTTETLRAVWGTSPNDVWAVGDAACVIHWDGMHWSRVAVGGLGGRRPDLYTVWTATPGKVWIGGDSVLLTLGGEP